MNKYRWIEVKPQPPENFESVEWEGCRIWTNKDGKKHPHELPTLDAESIEGWGLNANGIWQFKIKMGN